MKFLQISKGNKSTAFAGAAFDYLLTLDLLMSVSNNSLDVSPSLPTSALLTGYEYQVIDKCHANRFINS